MNTASTRTRKFTALMAEATPLAAKSPAASSPNHPQKRATSWRRSPAPHWRSTANSKRSRNYHSFKQRLTLQTGPVQTRKHESEGKGHLRPQQTSLLRRRQPLRRKKSPAHRKSEIWKELAARRMQFAASSLGPKFQQEALMKKSR